MSGRPLSDRVGPVLTTLMIGSAFAVGAWIGWRAGWRMNPRPLASWALSTCGGAATATVAAFGVMGAAGLDRFGRELWDTLWPDDDCPEADYHDPPAG